MRSKKRNIEEELGYLESNSFKRCKNLNLQNLMHHLIFDSREEKTFIDFSFDKPKIHQFPEFHHNPFEEFNNFLDSFEKKFGKKKDQAKERSSESISSNKFSNSSVDLLRNKKDGGKTFQKENTRGNPKENEKIVINNLSEIKKPQIPQKIVRTQKANNLNENNSEINQANNPPNSEISNNPKKNQKESFKTSGHSKEIQPEKINASQKNEHNNSDKPIQKQPNFVKVALPVPPNPPIKVVPKTNLHINTKQTQSTHINNKIDFVNNKIEYTNINKPLATTQIQSNKGQNETKNQKSLPFFAKNNQNNNNFSNNKNNLPTFNLSNTNHCSLNKSSSITKNPFSSSKTSKNLSSDVQKPNNPNQQWKNSNFKIQTDSKELLKNKPTKAQLPFVQKNGANFVKTSNFNIIKNIKTSTEKNLRAPSPSIKKNTFESSRSPFASCIQNNTNPTNIQNKEKIEDEIEEFEESINEYLQKTCCFCDLSFDNFTKEEREKHNLECYKNFF